MCLSLDDAAFSGTILYAGLGAHPQTGAPVHVMGYQNRAKNRAPGPNAMLLALPAKGHFGQEHFLDMRSCRSAMDDMVTALEPRGRPKNLETFGTRGPAQVFNHDIYTVVVATDAHSIPAALERVPIAKRPRLKPELFDYLARCKERQFVLCCFDNRDAAKAAPLVAYYEPLYPETLVAPAIDGHDGGAPLNGEVMVDHWLIFGTSDPLATGARVRYRDTLPASHEGLLPAVVTGRELKMPMYNGDFAVLADRVMPMGPDDHRRMNPIDARCGLMRVTPDEVVDRNYFVRMEMA